PSLLTRAGARPPGRRFRPSRSTSAVVSRRLPTTTSSTKRLSGSKATWSHWSLRNQSRSSSGSPCLCFLPTKDHFSSSCTVRVWGGKGHPFVVQPLGVLAGQAGQAPDGVLVDADQACGLADAAAVGEVLQDRQERVARQAGVEQRRALAFGEAVLAATPGQQTPPL